jgi:hypothetical protein
MQKCRMFVCCMTLSSYNLDVMSLSLSADPSTHSRLWIHRISRTFIYRFIYLPIQTFTSPTKNSSDRPFVYRSIHQRMNPSANPSIYQFIHSSTYQSINSHPLIHSSINLFIHPSIYLSFNETSDPFIHPPIKQSISPLIYPFSNQPPIYL